MNIRYVVTTHNQYSAMFVTHAALLHLYLITFHLCSLSQKKHNKIWGRAAPPLLKKNIKKKLEAELKNRTICLHLSHIYERLLKLWWCQNLFKTWQIIFQVRTHLVRRLHAPIKTQQDAHLKVREGDALTSNFPTFHHHVSIIMQGY